MRAGKSDRVGQDSMHGYSISQQWACLRGMKELDPRSRCLIVADNIPLWLSELLLWGNVNSVHVGITRRVFLYAWLSVCQHLFQLFELPGEDWWLQTTHTCGMKNKTVDNTYQQLCLLAGVTGRAYLYAHLFSMQVATPVWVLDLTSTRTEDVWLLWLKHYHKKTP